MFLHQDVSPTITLDPVNDAPVVLDDSYSTDEDTLLHADLPGVLANDSDADSDPLSAILVTGATHGAPNLNPDGSFDYAPNAAFSGTDSFTYRANDGTAASNVATVTITVNPVNDPPDVPVVSGGACLSDTSAKGTIKLIVGDDGGASNLFLSATSSNTNLVPTNNIIFGGSGENRTMQVSAAPKKSGTVLITVMVSDKNGGVTRLAVKVWVGTPNSETITGDEGADMIFGLAGQNTLNGAGGNDLVCGGNGNDTINGGDGNDVLDGGRGDDVINSGDGNDTLLGNAGRDTLRGEKGDDTLTGGTGADSFSGDDGTADKATDFKASQGETKDNTIEQLL